ncbi:heavy metal translocating P-type ATPase [uncultured Helicobacter sp.]|uniref:heavy metal translocating P-type ATPase n=1 Tax=uncultured Helicobacter sp. TaxID=175537 RepID=UPI00374F249D
MKEASFYIDGMSCSACSSGIERSLSRKPYCKAIQVNLISQKAHITYDENLISLEEIFAFIAKLGYAPSMLPPQSKNTQESPQGLLARLNALDAKLLPPKRRLILAIIFTLITLVFAFNAMFSFLKPHAIISLELDSMIMLFSTLVVMHMGRNFYFKGFKALIVRNPTMDSLIALGTSAAFLYSLKGMVDIFVSHAHTHLYFESVSVILCFVMIGKYIENVSKEDAKQSANFLLEINQKKVLKRAQNGEWVEVLAQEVQKDDVIKILPGDMVLVDGIVIEGCSSVDESSINGESIPVLKNVGDTLFSGSINIEGALVLQAMQVGSQTMLSQIFTLIANATESKAPIGILADKIAGVFVPVVIAIALVAGVFWWVARDFGFGLDVFIATLVISCPCALGLATPMAFLHAKAKAAKMGVFFKTASCLESLSKITHIVFDKTGTLSDGLEVFEAKSEIEEREFLSIVRSLESNSAHIIAQALTAYATAHKAELKSVQSFESIAGFGIKGEIEDKTYILGNLECIKLHNPHTTNPFVDCVDSKLAVYLADSQEILGVLYLRDLLRPEIIPTLQSLRAQNLHLTMLSGDTKESARASAEILGISEVIAQAKPKDKLEFITRTRAEDSHAQILMVGDGVNDAAALKSADVSMAYASGNDVAQNCADIIIYNHNAKAILNAYNLSKATIANIKGNLFWAFGYNIVFIPIACGVLGGFGIFLDPMFCALAMSFSSISVVLNSSRLRRFEIL